MTHPLWLGGRMDENQLALKRCFSLGWLIILLITVLPLRLRGAAPPQHGNQQALVQAKSALRRGDYPRAVDLYRQVLRNQPDNADGLLGLAKAHLLSGQFKSAQATYRSLLHRDPHNRDAQIGLGETYNLSGQYAEAEGPLKQALSEAPSNANAAWALSRTYFYERRFDHAEQLLKRVLVKQPNDYRLWESLGEVQLEEGHGAEAWRSLKRALSLNPKARRSKLLLQHLETKGAETPVKMEFHNYAYLLSDGAGNQILTLPQTLSFAYGDRWRSHLTGEYRRVAFRSASSEGVPASEAQDAGSTTTLALGIASLRDSTEFRINDEFTLTGGGGIASYLGRGMVRPIYNGGFNYSPTSRLQLSYNFGQNIVAPTEVAARLGLTERGWSSHIHYLLPESTGLDLTYYQDQYSDSNRLRGGHGEIRHVLWQKPVRVTVGYQLESLSFAKLDLFHGYFNPKRYIANSGLVNFQGHKGRFHYDYDFSLGEETYTRPVIRALKPLSFVAQRRSNPRFIATFRNSYDLNQHWSFQFSVLFYHSALSSTTGAYQAHAFLFGLTRRF
ncbi:MAG: tetratricopeptide repeat protein [Terriglobia bacterium]